LNAFAAGRLLRLADLPQTQHQDTNEVLNRIRYAVNDADPQWEKQGTLSQKAIRALRSTAGVSAVLVGMRRDAYVEDVLSELKKPLEQKDRQGSWARLRQGLVELFPPLR
jgi:aryl-alcohol dehydrogenase-like predicted oxidoreductase